MSRIGRQPVVIPAGVTYAQSGGQVVIEGLLGRQEFRVSPAVRVIADETDHTLRVEIASADRRARAIMGSTQAILQNMVEGVSKGFARQLQLVGVGYRAQTKDGQSLELNLGFSHPIRMQLPTGIQAEVKDNTIVTLRGCDKAQVGQVAANIRALRPPEPYQGKGVRYVGERIRLKAGKTGKK